MGWNFLAFDTHSRNKRSQLQTKQGSFVEFVENKKSDYVLRQLCWSPVASPFSRGKRFIARVAGEETHIYILLTYTNAHLPGSVAYLNGFASFVFNAVCFYPLFTTLSLSIFLSFGFDYFVFIYIYIFVAYFFRVTSFSVIFFFCCCVISFRKAIICLFFFFLVI